jgi:hypothetical protein
VTSSVPLTSEFHKLNGYFKGMFILMIFHDPILSKMILQLTDQVIASIQSEDGGYLDRD